MAGPTTITFLKTEEFSKKSSQRHWEMKEQGLLIDFTIEAEEQEFECHQIIVAGMSGYLKSLLTSDMVERAKRRVKLPQFSALIVTLLLQFIYCGEIYFDSSNLMELLQAAHYLEIEELVARCSAEVGGQLTASNTLDWLHMGQKLDLDSVQTTTTQFLIDNYATVLKEKAFLSLEAVGVCDYFTLLQGPGVQHDVLLRGAMRWVAHDAGGRAKHLHQLMKTLAVQNCSLSALIQVMGQYGEVIGPNLPVLNMMTEAMQRLTVQNEPQTQAANEEAKKTKEEKRKRKSTRNATATTTDPQVTTGQTKPMLVIAGGNRGFDANSTCWGMNTPNKFSQLTQIPAQGLAMWHSVCATEGGFIVTGGMDSDMCLMFTAATMFWQGMRKLRSARSSHASICIRGVLWILGGWVNGRRTESVECMELSGNQWQDGPHLPKPVGIPKVAELRGRLYLLDSESGCLYELDVARRVWRERARMPLCAVSVSMASAKSKLAVMGGKRRISMLYDPTNDAWTQCEQPRHAHWHGALVYYGDRLLLMGGQSHGAGSDAVESYNLDDGTWSASDITMPTNNLDHHHALVLTTPHDR